MVWRGGSVLGSVPCVRCESHSSHHVWSLG